MKTILLITFLSLHFSCLAQNDRLRDPNNTNWIQTFNTIGLDKKWSLHVEYQWRRTNGLKHWQQSLFRIGVNRKINEQVTLHAGYGWIETFPYGDFPIASAATFPEHRVYEQVSFRQPINKWIFTHRFRIEQRWLGRVRPGTDREIEAWTYLHRFRYQFRAQLSLSPKWYAVAADEIFIGAGKNVGINIFDQNRIFLLAGFKINQHVSAEAGYFNQTLQQGRRINNKSIMQGNNGIVVSSFVQL
ncbi:MAG: DUF2490 domain-containing protein [Ferruginibacter sp.]|nr:DUF2490 domain-containing protein [Chitinophagaceae bacterium]